MNEVSYVRENISIEDLIYLRKCRKSLEFNELSLNYRGYESAKIVRKALDSLKSMKEISKETAFKKINEIFDKEYLREWFSFQYQYEQALERDMIRVNRIVEYICSKNYSLLETDIPFNIKLGKMYRGYQINNIAGKVDFVFGEGDQVILVNILSGENPYSNRARKAENLEDNSMELLTTALGFENKYPDKKIFAESWYLKNKDDKTFSMVTEYENKRGKNIASIAVTNYFEIRQRFYMAATFQEEGTEQCEGCIHKSVCRISLELHQNEAMVEEKSSTTTIPTYTENQKVVVEHMEGSMCVIAGPGAGKTFVLVNRLANMLRKGIIPENILFVTFTKKAADEIKQRVMNLLGTKDQKAIPNIFTYNAFGYSILKENPMFLGKRVRLADKVDRYSMIGEALNNSPKINNVSYDGIYSEYGLIKSLDKWFAQIDESGKEEFIKKYEMKKDVNGIIAVYDKYVAYFKERGYISYDMQISLVNDLFSKFPSLPAVYAKKYRYIMLDEFQDTSEDQANMTYSIAKKHGNIVVVGDDDQSIYGWRGGSNKYLLDFGHDFPNSKIAIMNDNFRSSSEILASANVVIKNNGNRYEKELYGHKESSYKPIYLKDYTADKVSLLVEEIIRKGYQPGDIAILARNHKRLREVYDALDGVVNIAAPNEFIYEDAVFQTLYDVLTLYYVGMDEDEALYRTLRILGVDNIHKAVKSESLYHNLISSNQLLPIDKMDVNCLASYSKCKEVSTMMMAGYKIISCFKKILYGKGLAILNDILLELFGMTEHKVLNALLDLSDERAFMTVSELYNFMTDMKLYQDDKTVEYNPSREAVNLLTSHSAKGKEFPVVIVYGTEDFNTDEEEVRLFYVSITRAKKILFFIETICNNCELFQKLQGSVEVRM